jgi:hypothetical protein
MSAEPDQRRDEAVTVTVTTTDAAPASADSPAARPRRRRGWLAVVAAAAIAAGGVGVALTRDDGTPSPATPITAAALEARYGTRIDLVALTALGGLVQLRFTVLDEAKAHDLFASADAMPAIVAEPSGRVLRAPTGMRHHLALLDGGSYFVLYANAANAVQRGTPVSIQIDDVKLEHVVTAG